MRKWVYVGDHKRVSFCKWHRNLRYDGDECANGSCPGHIDHSCRFYDGEPHDEYKHLFKRFGFIPITELVS